MKLKSKITANGLYSWWRLDPMLGKMSSNSHFELDCDYAPRCLLHWLIKIKIIQMLQKAEEKRRKADFSVYKSPSGFSFWMSPSTDSSNFWTKKLCFNLIFLFFRWIARASRESLTGKFPQMTWSSLFPHIIGAFHSQPAVQTRFKPSSWLTGTATNCDSSWKTNKNGRVGHALSLTVSDVKTDTRVSW